MWEVGDVVRLNGGGPAMTVIEPPTLTLAEIQAGRQGTPENHVWVTWIASFKNRQTAHFHEDTLELVD